MEDERFRRIVITMPCGVEGETGKIIGMLDSDPSLTVHLRHPGWDIEKQRAQLAGIPGRLHTRLRLHGHIPLFREFPDIGGVHLNSRNEEEGRHIPHRSFSCHSFEEAVTKSELYDYVTVSPVFPSISKPGYLPTHDFLSLPRCLQRNNIIALGGVVPHDEAWLRHLGFGGMAIMGAAWGLPFEERRPPMHLQFITNAQNADGTVSQALRALEGGCRWTQVRMKHSPDDEIEKAVKAILPLYRAKNAVVTVDDRTEVVLATGADGVHLGKNDMPVREARKILGPRAIIGATANTIDEVMQLASEPVDYLGIGPYKFTTTKERLAPIIGIEGYRSIVAEMKRRKIRLPFVAIGGIGIEDIPLLREAGVDGIALSGAVASAPDTAKAMSEILELTSRL